MSAVTFSSPSSTSVVEGLGIPYGSREHKDAHGEYFTPSTDFEFGWTDGTRPLLFAHGIDPTMGATPIGRITEYEPTALGIHWRVRLNAKGKASSAVIGLVDNGKAFFSSGALPHLVKTAATGEIIRWVWVEGSITPTPANRDAVATRVKGLAVKSADSPVRFVAAEVSRDDLEAIADRVRDYQLRQRAELESLYFDFLVASRR